MSAPQRRFTMAIIGSGRELEPQIEEAARALGRAAVDAGFQLITGGQAGVMEAACCGAHEAEGYWEGCTVGILPGYEREAANPFVDVAIATGAGHMRNIVVVASADCVAVVAGASGTLAEIAMAWRLDRPVLTLRATGGWAARLDGQTLDDRFGDPIEGFDEAATLVARALEICQAGGSRRRAGDLPGGCGPG